MIFINIRKQLKERFKNEYLKNINNVNKTFGDSKGYETKSLSGDFLELIRLLWQVEEFNMWDQKEHSSIAYVLDIFYGSEKYHDIYNKLYICAKNKDYNEFSLEMAKATLEAYNIDPNVDKSDIIFAETKLTEQREMYVLKKLYVFGFVNDKYVPNWFYVLFDNYIKIEEFKRDDEIHTYLIKKHNMSNQRIDETVQKLKKYYDIFLEFYFYVKNDKFKESNPIIEETYSAQQLYNTKQLSILGAYNYLIYLRENPDLALNDLKRGLPNKDSSSSKNNK